MPLIVVATVSLGLILLTAPRPLVSPALVAPVAVLVAGVGGQGTVDPPVPMLLATVVLLGLGRVGTTLPSTPLSGSIGTGAYVGSGTTIREDVPAGSLAISAGKQRNIEGWVADKKKKKK